MTRPICWVTFNGNTQHAADWQHLRDDLFKGEHLQRTGSFKMRGAMNKLLCLNDGERHRGVITASSGNHGMATTQAAR